MAEQITIAKDIKRVSCTGGGGALGHPQIWLTMTAQERGQPAQAVCPYCSRQFSHAD